MEGLSWANHCLMNQAYMIALIIWLLQINSPTVSNQKVKVVSEHVAGQYSHHDTIPSVIVINDQIDDIVLHHWQLYDGGKSWR